MTHQNSNHSPGNGPADRGFGNPYGTSNPFGTNKPPARAGGGRAAPSKQSTKSSAQKRGTGFRFALGYLAVIWAVHFANLLFFGGGLNYYGVQPLDTSSLWHIFLAPLLHADVSHLISNSIPGAIFCFLIGYSGSRVFWEVTGIALITAGLGTWFFGGVGTNHIGASGLVYGWLAYLIVRGFFNRSGQQIILGLLLGFMYSGLIWGVLPGAAGVSWQGHLFGALGGIAAGMLITSDDPPELVAKRQKRQAMKGHGNV